jgi:hypothetical protein
VSADRTVTAVTDNDGYYEVLLAHGTVVSKAPDDGMFLYQN